MGGKKKTKKRGGTLTRTWPKRTSFRGWGALQKQTAYNIKTLYYFQLVFAFSVIDCMVFFPIDEYHGFL